MHDGAAARVVAEKRDLLTIGRPDGKRIRSGIGRQTSYVRRADGLHVDVVVVLSLSVPGERHLRAVWRKRRRDFETIQGRQLHDLHGGRQRHRSRKGAQTRPDRHADRDERHDRDGSPSSRAAQLCFRHGACDRMKLDFHVGHSVEAPIRLLFQAASDHSLQAARRVRGCSSRSRAIDRQAGWIGTEDRGHDILRGSAGERRAPRDHLAEYASKREDVASGIRLFAAHLLGRHVLRSAGDHTSSGRPRVISGWHSRF